MANIRRAGRKRVLEHVRAASEVVGAGVLQLINDERERHSRNRRCRSGEVRGPYCHLFLIWPLFTISTATRLYKKEASTRLRIKAPLEDVSPSRGIPWIRCSFPSPWLLWRGHCWSILPTWALATLSGPACRCGCWARVSLWAHWQVSWVTWISARC